VKIAWFISHIESVKKTFKSEEKWGLTKDYMKIVGKYFENNMDYVNVMKVSKEYRYLDEEYTFNPIGDISLFREIKFQHFYEKEDVNNMREGLSEYIYWFSDDELIKKKKGNEIFKPINKYKYILNSIPVLKEWSGLSDFEVIFDSEKYVKSSSKESFHKQLCEEFKKCIFRQSNIYKLYIDSDGNIICQYQKNGDNDEGVFISQFNDGTKEYNEYDFKGKLNKHYVYRNSNFYGSYGYLIGEVGKKDCSFIHKDLINCYKDIKGIFELTNGKPNKFGNVHFTTERVVVIRMKKIEG